MSFLADPRKRIRELLIEAAEGFRDARAPSEISSRLEQLAGELDQPCVLAVVGRAKAGKSTLVNALLGADLAKIGATETTATINFFCYGQPSHPDRPIRCYWRNGRYEDVDRAFLDSLQGNDCETLRRAAAIQRLEYRLLHDALREITIVDTPGTEAAVEAHHDTTAEFLRLKQQLREQHNQQTEHWTTQADAVIYLISQVPRITDKELLEEFQAVTGGRSRALNAVGVIAKVDLYPDIRSKVDKIAAQLSENLNTVVAVSAGLRRALDRLLENNAQGLQKMAELLARIPRPQLSKLLDSSDLYEQVTDCPVSLEERLRLRAEMPWSVFTTIAKTLVLENLTLEQAERELEQLAGFQTLCEVLERHFFKRAKLLRAFRILNAAREVLHQVQFSLLPKLAEQDREDQKLRDRFLRFIRSARGDPETAKQLEDFVCKQLIPYRQQRLLIVYNKTSKQISEAYHELEAYNADFEALTTLEQRPSVFTQEELAELRCLFGLYGFDAENRLNGRVDQQYVSSRLEFWHSQALVARDPVRCEIADRAEQRYNSLLAELKKSSS